MRLRYTGVRPVTLPTLGLEVEPGEELELADPAGAAFTGRPDFELVDAPEEQAELEPATEAAAPAQASSKRKTTKAAASDPAGTQHTDETAPTA